jgi:hypothetical protein
MRAIARKLSPTPKLEPLAVAKEDSLDEDASLAEQARLSDEAFRAGTASPRDEGSIIEDDYLRSDSDNDISDSEDDYEGDPEDYSEDDSEDPLTEDVNIPSAQVSPPSSVPSWQVPSSQPTSGSASTCSIVSTPQSSPTRQSRLEIKEEEQVEPPSKKIRTLDSDPGRPQRYLYPGTGLHEFATSFLNIVQESKAVDVTITGEFVGSVTESHSPSSSSPPPPFHKKYMVSTDWGALYPAARKLFAHYPKIIIEYKTYAKDEP